MDTDKLLSTSLRLRAALTPADLDETLAQITAAAVEVLPEVQYSSITIKHADGRLETFAPTDDLLREVDAEQYELQEGPCYEAAVDTVHITAPNLSADSRFPRYAPIAGSAGLRAQAGIRLFETKASNGALNLYSQRVGAFENLGVLGELFAHQSAMALEYAREITNLKQAVETRQLIGQGVGIVMERFGLDEARAFGFLTRLSQDNNIKIRDIARELVNTAPAPPQHHG
jgi:hypothetical protein